MIFLGKKLAQILQEGLAGIILYQRNVSGVLYNRDLRVGGMISRHHLRHAGADVLGVAVCCRHQGIHLLEEAIRILRDIPGIGIVELTGKDIVRHELVQKIVEAYESRGRNDSEGKETV